MKNKIIETAGKTWKILGEKKEVKVTDLAKLVKEKGEIVFQSLGWLAREDKINYISRSNQTFVSLVEPEFEHFRNTFSVEKTPAKGTSSIVKSKVKKVLKKIKN
ncbi:MAG: winged helix-turn-helix domain-containing protein [Candidatus Omnitrophica bacterium]|nr:winged helix-turn-helix domain-containing protein [Candidatus Omnitrophota bacterium]